MSAPGSFSSLIVGQAVIEATGQNLYLNGQILQAGGSGSVASINSQSGAITLAGAGNISVTTNGPILTVSGNTGIYSSFVTTGMTGSFTANTGVLTGVFYPLISNPSNYINSSQTGNFADKSYVGTVSGLLNTQITNLSGYDAATYATITNLTSTGSSLNNLITGVSGLLTGFATRTGNLIDLTNKQTARINLGGSPDFQGYSVYISENGSDSNDGQSWNTSLRTIASGLPLIVNNAGGDGAMYISGNFTGQTLPGNTSIRNLKVFGYNANIYLGVLITGAAWSNFTSGFITSSHNIYRAPYSGGIFSNDNDGGCAYVFEQDVPEGLTAGEIHPLHRSRRYVLDHRRVKYSPSLSGLITGVAGLQGSGHFFYDSGANLLYLRNIDGINPVTRRHWVPNANNATGVFLAGAGGLNNSIQISDVNVYFGYVNFQPDLWPTFKFYRCQGYGGLRNNFSVIPCLSGYYEECRAYASSDDGFTHYNYNTIYTGYLTAKNIHSAYNGDGGIDFHGRNITAYIDGGLLEHNRSAGTTTALGGFTIIRDAWAQSNNKTGEENGWLDPTVYRGQGFATCCGEGSYLKTINCYAYNETVGYYAANGTVSVNDSIADKCDQVMNNSPSANYSIASISKLGNETQINTVSNGIYLRDGQIVTIVGVTGNTPSLSGSFQIRVLDESSFVIPVITTIVGASGSFFPDRGLKVAGVGQYKCGNGQASSAGNLISGGLELAAQTFGTILIRATGNNQLQIRKPLQGGTNDIDLIRLVTEFANGDGTAFTNLTFGTDGSVNGFIQCDRALSLYAGTPAAVDGNITLRTFGASADAPGGSMTIRQWGTLAVPSRSNDPLPASSTSGDIYYNSVTGNFRGYTSGQWRTFLMS